MYNKQTNFWSAEPSYGNVIPKVHSNIQKEFKRPSIPMIVGDFKSDEDLYVEILEAVKDV